MKYYVGIDLGGTFIKAGVVDENYNILAKASVPSHSDGDHEALADRMAQAVKESLDQLNMTIADIEAVGVGSPGSIDSKNGVAVYGNNIPFLNTPLGAMLEKRIGKPVYLENDANVAAYGEALAGGARGVQNVLVITLGTGVGSGVIIDGKIYSGFNSFGAELGHTVVEYNGRPCTCGRKGCLEAYASATGLINLTKEEMQNNPDSKMWEIAAGSLDNVDGKTAFDAMRAGDASGKKIVDTYIGYLGCGLASFVNIFQPEVLLIGGGICKEGETLLAPLREIVKKEAFGIEEVQATELRVCELGNDAGTIGAAMLWKLHQ